MHTEHQGSLGRGSRVLLLRDLGRQTWSLLLSCSAKQMESFEGGFAMDGSEVESLEKGVLVINVDCHGG